MRAVIYFASSVRSSVASSVGEDDHVVSSFSVSSVIISSFFTSAVAGVDDGAIADHEIEAAQHQRDALVRDGLGAGQVKGLDDGGFDGIIGQELGFGQTLDRGRGTCQDA